MGLAMRRWGADFGVWIWGVIFAEWVAVIVLRMLATAVAMGPVVVVVMAGIGRVVSPLVLGVDLRGVSSAFVLELRLVSAAPKDPVELWMPVVWAREEERR